MLRVEILAPYGAGWVDHIGNHIEKLVFSKEWHSAYEAGHYPLESAGALYRNIDNFRESPLQSRTDWEIRVPGIYSGGGIATLDLMQWLEGENNERGIEFDLSGCAAVLLYGDDKIFTGMVESVATGGGATAIRISDLLGNPKAPKSNFLAAVGDASLASWQASVTETDWGFIIEASPDALPSKPVLKFKAPSGKMVEFEIYDSGNTAQAIWSVDNRSVEVFALAITQNLPIAISKTSGFIFEWNSAYYRWQPQDGKPDAYTLGIEVGEVTYGNNLTRPVYVPGKEIIESWSVKSAAYGSKNHVSFGRPREGWQDYKAGSPLLKFLGRESIEMRFKLRAYPQSLLLFEASEWVSQWGNPSFFLQSSSHFYTNDVDFSDPSFNPSKDKYPEFFLDSGHWLRLEMSLSAPDMPSGSRRISGLLSLAIEAAPQLDVRFWIGTPHQDNNDDNMFEWKQGKDGKRYTQTFGHREHESGGLLKLGIQIYNKGSYYAQSIEDWRRLRLRKREHG